MAKKWNKRRSQKTLRGSDSRIVPLQSEDQSEGEKPGSTGVGKAAGISRDSDRAPPVLSDGASVVTRLDRSLVLALELQDQATIVFSSRNPARSLMPMACDLSICGDDSK